MSEIELRDAILRHSLQLLRLSAGGQAEAEQILKELERELRQLLNTHILSDASKSEIRKLIAAAEDAIKPAYARVATTVDTHALAVIVAEQTVQALEDVFPVDVRAPTVERLASLTKDVMIDGAPSSAWWARQAEDTAFRFAAEVRQGVINGETNERIVARISGDHALMGLARRNARTLVHSSVQAAANDARLATFRKNSRLISGVRWLSTLDSHTCRQCAALDGQAWSLEAERLKGTTVDFIAPPAHWSCRCVLSPIPKTFKDLGIDLPEPGEGTLASSNGPISSKTTFDEFLKRNPEAARKILGEKRLALFQAGRITLRDLISGTGRELTIDEL